MRARLTPLLVAAVTLHALTCAAMAATTVWTGPSRGDWGSASNWSNGIPSPADTAILPMVRRGGSYAIVVTSAAMVGTLDVRGHVTIELEDASLDAEALSIGASESAGLDVTGGPLQVEHATIGTAAGAGAIAFENGGALWADTLTVGVDGPATLTARTFVSVATGTLTLGSYAVVDIALDLTNTPAVFAGTMSYGGSLRLAYPDALPFPSPSLQAILSLSATGAFADISGPFALEQAALVVVGATGVVVPPFDPVVALEFDPHPSPAYVGYSRQIGLRARHASGAIGNVCCTDGPEATSWPWVVEDPTIASISDDGVLTGLAPGDTLISIEVERNGKLFSVAERCTVSTWSSLVNGVDIDCNGEPADGALCGVFASNGGYSVVSASADGRFIAFSTIWPAVGSIDECGIYVRDRVSGNVDATPAPPGAFGMSFLPDLSADGRYLTFSQQLGHRNEANWQVWLFDRSERTATLVSRSIAGEPGDDGSGAARISSDGSTVVYLTNATNIVSTLQSVDSQVVAYHRANGANTLVSATPDGSPANGPSEGPTASADGTRVAFSTLATNLVEPVQGGRVIVVKDLVTGACLLANRTVSEAAAYDWALSACDIDGTGERVVFASTTPSFVAGPTPPGSNVYLRDFARGTTTLLTPSTLPRCGLGAAQPAISADGTFVLCAMPKSTNGLDPPLYADESCRIYRIAVDSLAFEVVNAAPWDTVFPAVPSQPAFVGNGAGIVFESFAQGLAVGGPPGPIPHVYVRLFSATPADLNLDGVVDATDLNLLLGSWGPCAGAADLTQDGMIGSADLAVLLGAWTGGGS